MGAVTSLQNQVFIFKGLVFYVQIVTMVFFFKQHVEINFVLNFSNSDADRLLQQRVC